MMKQLPFAGAGTTPQKFAALIYTNPPYMPDLSLSKYAVGRDAVGFELSSDTDNSGFESFFLGCSDNFYYLPVEFNVHN